VSYQSIGSGNSYSESSEYIQKMRSFFDRGLGHGMGGRKEGNNTMNPVYKKYQYSNKSKGEYDSGILNMRGGALGDLRSGSVRGVSTNLRKPGLMMSGNRRRSNSPYTGSNKLDKTGFANLRPTKRSKKKKRNPLSGKYMDRTSSKKSIQDSREISSPARKETINSFKGELTESPSPGDRTHRLRMTASPKPQLSPLQKAPSPSLNVDDFFRFYDVRAQEYSKFKQLSFFEKCGFQLYSIKKNLIQKNDVYDLIRLYADFAQEKEFNYIEKIFTDKEARLLFSKVLKLERWAIILLFYFKVQKIKGAEFDNLAINLASEAWKNHNNLVNWIKVLNKEHNMKWILNDMNRIYWDVNMDIVRLIIHIRSCCRIITGLINQM
jgi:hypothetical protein